MIRQCNELSQRLSQGARHRGWKVGLTTPASQVAAGIDGALIGFLTDATEFSDGSRIKIDGWTRPMFEAEIAIQVGSDLEPGADESLARAAISALATAIEVVDLTVSLDQVEELLATNIFHRGFVLGPAIESRAGGDTGGIEVRAWLDNDLAAVETNPCAVIGDLPGVVQLVAREAARAGLRLQSGDWILAGSAIPLTTAVQGRTLRVEATGLGQLQATFG
jgi:2-keto-4-pentenoate hydratase